jgi:hypothetical protein
MPNELALRALRSGRLACLGATRAFHHALLGLAEILPAIDLTLFQE